MFVRTQAARNGINEGKKRKKKNEGHAGVGNIAR